METYLAFIDVHTVGSRPLEVTAYQAFEQS